MRASQRPIIFGRSLPIRTLRVLPSGWEATLVLSGAFGGTFAVGTQGSPGVALTVISKSWDSSGNQTAITRTIWATAAERLPYPNQASTNWKDGHGTVIVQLVLSDWIYAGDVVTGMSVASGFYTANSVANPAFSGSVQNLSTVAYPAPCAAFLNHDRDWLSGFSTYTVKMCVAHRHGQQGQMVRAVKFIATDLHGNSASVTVSSVTKTTYAATGLSCDTFSGDLDFSGLTQGDLCTIDAIIYPWVGEAWQVSVSGASYPSPNLTIFKVLNDRTGAYGTVYAYVDAGSGSGAAVSETAATAATTPFATIAAAASALQTYINAHFSRNSVSGGIIRLTATTHTHSTYSARAVTEIPLIIEAANAGNKSTTIYQDSGANIFNGCCDYLKIRNITLKKNGDSVTFLDMAATKNGNFLMVIDTCTFNVNGHTKYGAWLYQVGRLWLINCDGTDCGHGLFFASAPKHIQAFGSGSGSCRSAIYNAVACKDSTTTSDLISSVNIVANPTIMDQWEGNVFAFNFLSNGLDANKCIYLSSSEFDRGLAIFGNVLEQYGGTSGPALQLSDTTTPPVYNLIEVGNTVVGARTNLLYNDSGTVGVPKIGVSAYTVHFQWNCKTDQFSPGNANRTGNWSVIYRVGSSYRVALQGGTDGTGTPGTGNWIGQIAATGDAAGTSGSPINPAWANDQSFSGGKAGNGSYKPTAGTAFPQIPAGLTMFSWDQNGTAVPTDGTAYVGACQM